MPRSFHCSASHELPPRRAAPRFCALPALARRLPARALARVTTLWLDAFPDDSEQWAALSALPALRALVGAGAAGGGRGQG